MKPAASAVISPSPTRGHRVRSLARDTRARPERPEAAREPKPGRARVWPHQQGGWQRRWLGAGEGRPPGGAGGSSLPVAAASLPCATRPVPKNNVSLPGGRQGPAGGGGGGSAPRNLRRAAAQARRRWQSRRHPSALPAGPCSPPPPGSGPAHVGRGSAWRVGPGRGHGAGAPGRRRRVAGPGPDGGGCGGRGGGPGRARTWRLYLQSPSVRAAEPHAAAQT